MLFPGTEAEWHRSSRPPLPPLGRSPGAGDPEHRARGPTVRACLPVWKRDGRVRGLGRGAVWSAGQECGPLLLEGGQGRGRVPLAGSLPARGRSGLVADRGLSRTRVEMDRRVRGRRGLRRRLAARTVLHAHARVCTHTHTHTRAHTQHTLAHTCSLSPRPTLKSRTHRSNRTGRRPHLRITASP